MSQTIPIQALLEAVRAAAADSGVFGPMSIRGEQLVCQAKAAAAPASYRVFREHDRVFVSLVMADRWLSESIESDLMHTGDKMEDLLEEELVDQHAPVTRLPIEHFRSDDLLFTFRSPLPPAAAAAAPGIARCLLAYEACFRNLGDMNAGEEEGP